MTEPYVLPGYSKIGIVVHDIDKAVDFYSKAFGWKDWLVSDDIDISDTIYRGKKSNCKLKNALFPNPMTGGDGEHMQVELIEHKEGESPFKDFLEQKGEGLACLTIMVDNLEETVTEVTKEGCDKLFFGRWNLFGVEMDVAFIEAPLLGGVMYELIAFA